MENKVLKVMHTNGSLILKAHMAQNITFKFELKVMDHRCLTTTTSREKWIWHYRLENLNSRSQYYEKKHGYRGVIDQYANWNLWRVCAWKATHMQL